MLYSTNPVSTAIIAHFALGEPFGAFEVANLFTVIAGITLVLQPPILFGSEFGREFGQMAVNAIILGTFAPIIGGAIPVIIRRYY